MLQPYHEKIVHDSSIYCYLKVTAITYKFGYPKTLSSCFQKLQEVSLLHRPMQNNLKNNRLRLKLEFQLSTRGQKKVDAQV